MKENNCLCVIGSVRYSLNHTIIIIKNNMTNKKRVIVGSFATVIAAGALGVSVTNAYFGPKCQNHATVEEVIKNNNLKLFKSSTGDRPIADKISTRKDFSAITVAYDLRRDGKYKQARRTLEDAGIEHPGKKIRRHKRSVKIFSRAYFICYRTIPCRRFK